MYTPAPALLPLVCELSLRDMSSCKTYWMPPLKEGNTESGKITQPGSTNRSEHSSRDMTHIDQCSFNQPATGSVAGKEREREWRRDRGSVNVRWLLKKKVKPVCSPEKRPMCKYACRIPVHCKQVIYKSTTTYTPLGPQLLPQVLLLKENVSDDLASLAKTLQLNGLSV